MERRRFLTVGALALGGAAGLAGCAPQPHANPMGRELRASITFSEVSVTTAGAALESRRASEAATALGPELEAALRQAFSDRMAADGMARMVVEIDRFNLAGGTRTAFGSDQSRLSGAVRVLDGEGRLLGSYAVVVTAGEAAETRLGALAGAAVGSADRFRRQLSQEFARTSRLQVLGPDRPGPIEVGPAHLKYADGLVVHAEQSPYAFDKHVGPGGPCFVGSQGKVAVGRGGIAADPPELLDEPLGPHDVRLYYSTSHSGNFLDCVKTRKQPICDAESTHRAASLMLLGGVAMELDRTLRWDPIEERFTDDEANRLRSVAAREPWSV